MARPEAAAGELRDHGAGGQVGLEHQQQRCRIVELVRRLGAAGARA